MKENVVKLVVEIVGHITRVLVFFTVFILTFIVGYFVIVTIMAKRNEEIMKTRKLRTN